MMWAGLPSLARMVSQMCIRDRITIQEFNCFYERLKSMTLAQTEDFFDVNEE